MRLTRIISRLAKRPGDAQLDRSGDPRRRRDGPFAAAITDHAVIVASGPTEMLRASEAPFWVMLREQLRGHGIDHETAVLAESFEEGPTAAHEFDVREVGVIVAADERVVEYQYAYNTETWLIWEEITENWPVSEHGPAIQAALEGIRTEHR